MKTPVRIIAFILILFSFESKGQSVSTGKRTYTSFDFYYLDNNHGADAIGLNDSLIERMVQEIRKLLKQNDKGFLLFRSNGERPQITERKEDLFTFEFRDGIFEQNTAIPNFLEDKKRIREVLYDSIGVIQDKVNLHFLLSENALRSLQEDPNSMLSNFAREFCTLFAGKSAELNVMLYYNKEITSVNETAISNYLNFFNGTTYAERKINFTIIKS
ncbi:MAG TPA: hypothetical protein PKK99_14145 [Bacteroidia bacterium]|nr:hypothetical protein [Bacteroidia bacterium]HNQ00197.1 hypothetical protein [Bacteroidia bacterium]